jgi:hypothetical protein
MNDLAGLEQRTRLLCVPRQLLPTCQTYKPAVDFAGSNIP